MRIMALPGYSFGVISLYYTYHLFCGDKTTCVDVLHKEGEERSERERENERKGGKESEGC